MSFIARISLNWCVLGYVIKGSYPQRQKGEHRYNDKLRNPSNQETSPHVACPRAVMGETSVPLSRDETHYNKSVERLSYDSPLDAGS